MQKTCSECAGNYSTTERLSEYCSKPCFNAARSRLALRADHIRRRHDAHVDVTPGCWMWTGLKTAKGYGRMSIACRMELAHRIAYALYVGEIPAGLGVLHRCDNPPCVNPAHLFVGTAGDNAKDKAEKGRALRGELHPNAKFTAAQVAAMRADERPYNEIVAEYGISKPHLCGLKRGYFWRHLGEGA